MKRRTFLAGFAGLPMAAAALMPGTAAAGVASLPQAAKPPLAGALSSEADGFAVEPASWLTQGVHRTGRQLFGRRRRRRYWRRRRRY